MFIRHKQLGSTLFVAVLTAACLASPCDSRAASSYYFNMSFSEPMLEAHNSADADLVAHYEGWDSAIARIRKRNMPFIEITNTSSSATPLTQFQMTIAKPEYDFSDDVLLSYAKLGTTTPGVAMTSSSSDGGDTLLIVNFTDGLQPNETVRFQVDIDVNAAYPDLYPHPDYRMVFFDVNDNDDSDNSVLTATFQTASGPISLSQTLPDFSQSTPVFLNGGGLRNYNTMDGVEMFELEGVIPEPTTAALAFLSLAAVYGLRASRRRS